MTINPLTDEALVLRTDFSDENAWKEFCNIITSPQGEFDFVASVELYSDRMFNKATAEQILLSMPKNRTDWFLFIADNQTMTNPKHPVLCVDLNDEPGRKLRVIASEVWNIEANLSTANMDFSDFVNSADSDGVFHGF